jgi:hypothetical protein
MKNGGGLFAQELGAHFKLELGGHYHWYMQSIDEIILYAIISEVLDFSSNEFIFLDYISKFVTY